MQCLKMMRAITKKYDFKTIIANPQRGKNKSRSGLQGIAVFPHQRHTGKVGEGSFVDAHVETILCFHGQRCMNRIDFADGRLLIEILVPVPPIRADPPGMVISSQSKFGQFVQNLEVYEVRLLWDLIPKPDTIIEDTKDDGHAPFWSRDLGKVDAQFIVVVADIFLLTPWLNPCLVEMAHITGCHVEALRKRWRILQDKAKPR